MLKVWVGFLYDLNHFVSKISSKHLSITISHPKPSLTLALDFTSTPSNFDFRVFTFWVPEVPLAFRQPGGNVPAAFIVRAPT